MIAGGGTRTVTAQAAGIHPATIHDWMRRGTEDTNFTQTALDPDDYTSREVRALGKAAQIPGYTRLRKAELAAAIAAKPSEFSDFSDSIKKAEAEAENEWLAGVAHIARGTGVTTTVTEELDGAGNVKTRTTRTVTGLGSWQAYAWLLERRHPERWARTERPAAGDGAGTLDPEEVIARGEAQMRIIEGAGSREPDHLVEAGATRPDIVVELLTPGEPAKGILLEVKASRKGNYLGEGVTQALGYLADRPELFLTMAPPTAVVAPASNAFTQTSDESGINVAIVSGDDVGDWVTQKVLATVAT